jgi:hypothetical protein
MPAGRSIVLLPDVPDQEREVSPFPKSRLCIDMNSCRQFVVAVLLTLAVVCQTRAEDDPFVQTVAVLEAPE